MQIEGLRTQITQQSDAASQLVGERLQAAKMELDLKGQEMLQQLQHLWLSEKTEIREGVLRSLMAQGSSSGVVQGELAALREQTGAEMQRLARECQAAQSTFKSELENYLKNGIKRELQEIEMVLKELFPKFGKLQVECGSLRKKVGSKRAKLPG